LPPASSNLPGNWPRTPKDPKAGRAARVPFPYLVLLRMGFSLSSDVAAEAVRSYRTISPLPPARRTAAVSFLLHYPSRRRASPLASMPPVGARTFLSRQTRRPPGATAWRSPAPPYYSGFGAESR